ncbi:MAG TPA: MlaE family lipid ABC transporter permease subunit [Gammaproteobacteria bacterium]
MPTPPQISTEPAGERVCLAGRWVTAELGGLEAALAALSRPGTGPLTVDASGVTAFDTGGAWYLRRLLRRLRADGREVVLLGLRAEFDELYRLVDARLEAYRWASPQAPRGWLDRLGRRSLGKASQGYRLLAFVGHSMLVLLATLRQPQRLRWRSVLAEIRSAGVDALPIIGLLSFLIGIVIAYQGGVQLRNYGANIFVVELVTLTMLRELAPVMTAVIVAGRTGSAYTAQLGTMLVNDEIDAIRTMGLSPAELLVLPKLLGLMLALPLLTMFADILGVFGGMVMSVAILDVDMGEFLRRVPQAVSLTSFMIGIGKTPVFALLIAMVGCFQGFQVAGGADSVGRQTTVSVVQAIFLVIVTDAVFSIVFSWMRI